MGEGGPAEMVCGIHSSCTQKKRRLQLAFYRNHIDKPQSEIVSVVKRECKEGPHTTCSGLGLLAVVCLAYIYESYIEFWKLMFFEAVFLKVMSVKNKVCVICLNCVFKKITSIIGSEIPHI